MIDGITRQHVESAIAHVLSLPSSPGTTRDHIQTAIRESLPLDDKFTERISSCIGQKCHHGSSGHILVRAVSAYMNGGMAAAADSVKDTLTIFYRGEPPRRWGIYHALGRITKVESQGLEAMRQALVDFIGWADPDEGVLVFSLFLDSLPPKPGPYPARHMTDWPGPDRVSWDDTKDLVYTRKFDKRWNFRSKRR